MAVIKRGILGGFSGKVGNVVGTSWKGIAVMKVKPLSVANPRTVAQVAQRTKFGGVVGHGSKLLVSIVKPLWDANAQQMSGYNQFVKSNIDAYSDAGALDVTKFVPTLGKLDAQPIDSVSIVAGESMVQVNWLKITGTGSALDSDLMYAIAFNETTGEMVGHAGNVLRDDESSAIQISKPLVTGDIISVWLAAKSADGRLLFKAGSDLSGTVQ